MIHWKETAEILSRLAELDASGQPAALATVVRISGSAYRRPGAKFLIEESGGSLGGVSGGCLEADVCEIGRGMLAGGPPRLRHYETGSDADGDTVWGLGLGCEGAVDVLVQPASTGPLAAVAPRLRELLAGDDGVVVATVVAGDGEGGSTLVTAGDAMAPGSSEPDPRVVARARELLAGGRSSLEEVGGRTLFFDVLQPPRRLLVVGAGDDARPLVAYAADAGFRVTVVDHRPALLTPGRFPEAHATVRARPDDPEDAALPLARAPRPLAVVMTHSLAHDRAWARRLLAAGVPYLGLLGPRSRTGTILAELGVEGDPRVFGPVGLDLGADGPHQVALSIVAELLAFTSGRTPRHLATRREAIHAG